MHLCLHAWGRHMESLQLLYIGTKRPIIMFRNRNKFKPETLATKLTKVLYVHFSYIFFYRGARWDMPPVQRPLKYDVILKYQRHLYTILCS